MKITDLKSWRVMKPKKIGILTAKFLCIVLILWFIDLFSGGIFSPLPYRSLAPFCGKVVDQETKEPIAGAVVLAVYETISHTLGGDVGHIVDGQEALTDENGDFSIHRKRIWLSFRRGYTKARLIIFKPGYGTFPNHNQSVSVGKNERDTLSGKLTLYKLPKLNTFKERIKNISYMYPIYEINDENQKSYLKLLNYERSFCKLEPYN